MIYRPIYVEKIMAYTDTPFVKILTGVRRCGKSTILKMIINKFIMAERITATVKPVIVIIISIIIIDRTERDLYPNPIDDKNLSRIWTKIVRCNPETERMWLMPEMANRFLV